jgi:hypothetical protein
MTKYPAVSSMFNAVTDEEAKELIRRKADGSFTLDHVRAHVKTIIGMCVDEEPYGHIRFELWKITDELAILRAQHLKVVRGKIVWT